MRSCLRPANRRPRALLLLKASPRRGVAEQTTQAQGNRTMPTAMPTTQRRATRIRALILAALMTAGWQAIPAQAQDQSPPAAQPPAAAQTTPNGSQASTSVPDEKL